ncbi:uncharacterized protein LOC130932923 [Arachis stenosperma]|uniref:uncharacterized protein LOC130932923 n=1 Tax=Arachis stenosperma TaxID=217475 RepID=UPI0025ACF8C6|nr:uncharacterized protein LOC130932923 [Arachis stenosperma]
MEKMGEFLHKISTIPRKLDRRDTWHTHGGGNCDSNNDIPGGVWQENTRNGGHSCKSYGVCEAGTAVVGYVWSEDYVRFMFFNTISFFASLCVVLILISGFPLKNKVVMWVLTIDMTIAVSFMLLTYLWALGLVAPDQLYYRFYKIGFLLGGSWCIILLGIALIQTARLLFWIKKRNIIRASRSAMGC